MAQTITRERAADIVTRFFATLSSGDLDDLAEFLDEESEWAVARAGQEGGGTKGGDAIINSFFKPVREGLFEPRDPKIDIKNLLVDGDWVVVEGQGRGRLKNGNAYANRYVFCIRLVGDKIREAREYMDTAYAAEIARGIER